MWNSHLAGYEMPLSVSVSLHMGYLPLLREMLCGISGAGWVVLRVFECRAAGCERGTLSLIKQSGMTKQDCCLYSSSLG